MKIGDPPLRILGVEATVVAPTPEEPAPAALVEPDAPLAKKAPTPNVAAPMTEKLKHAAAATLSSLAAKIKEASPEKMRAELFAASRKVEGPLRDLLLSLRNGAKPPSSAASVVGGDYGHPAIAALREIFRQIERGSEEAVKGTADFATGVLDGIQPNPLAPSLGAPFRHERAHTAGAVVGAAVGIGIDFTGMIGGGGVAVAGAQTGVAVYAGTALAAACVGAAAVHGKHLADSLAHLYEPLSETPKPSTHGETHPTHAPNPDAVPSGATEKIRPHDDAATKRLLGRQNDLGRMIAKKATASRVGWIPITPCNV